MKKIFYALLAVCLLASAVLFASCGETQTGGKDETDSGKMTLVAIEDLSEFTIVRPDKGSDAEKTAATGLRKILSDSFGADVKISTDYSGEKQKEILVGHTSRTATKEAEEAALSYSEYVIKRTGNKIVILGGSDEALAAAIDFWTTSMVNKSGKLCIPSNESGYVYSSTTNKFDSLTVDGVHIGDFAVFNDSKVFASITQDVTAMIFEFADIKIDDTKTESENMIKICNPTDDVMKSSVEVKDGSIYITPSYYDTEWAIDYIKGILDSTSEKNLDITSAVNAEKTYEVNTFYDKNDIMAVLEDVYNSDKIIVGTEISNGVNAVSDALDYYYEESGEYPGILGLDVRLSNLHKLGEKGRAKVIADLTKYAEGGGIITASAHFSNPAENGGDPTVENYRGVFGGDSEWAKLVTEGTDYNTSFKKELEGIADFFEALRDNGVPVIWRPLHETNGNWFWFCMVQPSTGEKISEESFSNLWIYIHDYFTIERGLDNLLWEFGPNIGKESATMTEPLYGFPGKEYVDMVGFDWYTSDGDASRIEAMPTYSDLASLGMIVNICEFGPAGDLQAKNGQNQEELFSCRDILGMLEEIKRLNGDYKLGYFLTWTDVISIPSLGHSDEFMAHEMTLGQAEVRAMFEELK